MSNMISRLTRTTFLCASLAVSGASIAQSSRVLSGEMSGDAERPGPGDPDGSGTFEFRLNKEGGELCYRLNVEDIQPATAAHIHAGELGESGPPVVTLEPPTDGSAEGCTQADRDLLNAIFARPTDYYVNVHNAELPAGAVRGQLE